MQIRKKDYSDALLEDLLFGVGYSPILVNAVDQKQAEDAFTTELTNGPKQKVTYASGKSFMVPIGTFDLENFHKAYDQYFNDNGLLGLFKDSGLLAGSSIYGEIKKLNQKEPAVKALYKLWGAQFRGDMKFTNSNATTTANNSSANPPSGNPAWTTHISPSSVSINPVTSVVWDTIIGLPEFDELETAYDNKYGKFGASFKLRTDETLIYQISITLSGILVPIKGPSKDAYNLDLLTQGPVPINEFCDCLSGKATSTTTGVSASAIADYKKRLAAWLKNLLLIYKGCEFTLANAAAFKTTTFGEICAKLRLSINGATLVAFNKKDSKYYLIKPVCFTKNIYPYPITATETGAILMDVETDTNKTIPINDDLLPAILVNQVYSSSNEPNYFYNSWVPDNILQKFNIKTLNNPYTKAVTSTNNLCTQYFDTMIYYNWSHL